MTKFIMTDFPEVDRSWCSLVYIKKLLKSHYVINLR
jgi:hypothetical protein